MKIENIVIGALAIAGGVLVVIGLVEQNKEAKRIKREDEELGEILNKYANDGKELSEQHDMATEQYKKEVKEVIRNIDELLGTPKKVINESSPGKPHLEIVK
jgi:hypothetical protein